MSAKILSFGEILWDIYPNEKHLGGASLNFAAHLAKFGHRVDMLSALGADSLGEEARAQLRDWNLGDRFVPALAGRETGACLVTLDENSIPSYNLLKDVAYDCISCEGIREDFDLLYFGTLALRSEYNFASLTELLKQKSFGEIFVDMNIRPPFYSEKTVRFAVSRATVLKISDEELPTVARLLGTKETEPRAFAAHLAKAFSNLRCIIITLGGEGAYALSCEDEKGAFCPAKKVSVKSTVGAGDSFGAAFVSEYLSGKDLLSCLQTASAVAGFVVSQTAAVPDYKPADLL
ncbi:MAG: carbohydrate kinase [Ruminococcaceae bacterium]|nr:carbohydrate kinase [Oscillospiraceae bacterium]